MAILREDFNGVSNGTALTNVNTSFTTVQGTLTADNAAGMEGGISAKVAASSVAGYGRWSGLSMTDFKTRFLLDYTTLQSADHWPFVAAVGSTRIIVLGCLTTNKMRLYTAAGTGTTIWTANNAFVAGQVYRVEVYMSGLSASTATVKVAIFGGSSVQTALSSTTPRDSYDGTGVSNTGLTAIDNVSYGKYNSVTLANDHNVDAVALDTSPSSDYAWPIYTRTIPTPVPSRAVARAANY